jgi:hypothetical protein
VRLDHSLWHIGEAVSGKRRLEQLADGVECQLAVHADAKLAFVARELPTDAGSGIGSELTSLGFGQ